MTTSTEYRLSFDRGPIDVLRVMARVITANAGEVVTDLNGDVIITNPPDPDG